MSTFQGLLQILPCGTAIVPSASPPIQELLNFYVLQAVSFPLHLPTFPYCKLQYAATLCFQLCFQVSVVASVGASSFLSLSVML